MSANISKVLSVAIAVLLVVLVGIEPAVAQRRGGGGFRGGGGGFRGGGGGFRGGGFGGGGFARASARPSISRPAASFRPSGGMNVARPPVNAGNISRPGGGRIGNAAGDVGRPGNNLPGRGNINRPINGNGNNIINNRPINGGDINVGGDWDDHYHGCCGYGWGAGAFAAGAAVTAAAIGSTVYALPSDCVVTVVNGVTYQQCGSTWYQPYFDGTTTSYVVVSAPQ